MTIGTMVNENVQSKNLFERNIIECPCTWKGTFDAGYLIPVFWCPTLPGDTFKLDATFFARLSTQALPPMDNIYLDWHFYWSADRFVWDNFLKFMGEKENPEDSIDYLTPIINSGDTGFDYETPFDYVGCPPKVANYDVVSLLFRHMNLIWNKWYRAENIQNSLPVPKGDGPDPLVQSDGSATFPLLPRGKRGDYFTLGLPEPYSNAGVNPVTLPLGTSAPVNVSFKPGHASVLLMENSETRIGIGSNNNLTCNSGVLEVANAGRCCVDNTANISAVADLASAVSPTINSLRQAIALQQFLEMEQRGGSRYIELMYSAFGVLSSNRALQRPEFLGGTTTMINVNVVPQTSSTDSTTPQGNLSAYSTCSGTGIGFTRSFEEHGFVIGFVSARTDLTYQQGLDRLLTKRTRYDYYWNQFAHLGEQEVKNKEIYVQPNTVLGDDGVTPVNEETFSFMPRFSEYRFKNSLITGRFRSSYPQSLDAYHYSEYFGSLPQLNEDFIKVPAGKDGSGNWLDPIKRTLAVQDEPDFMLDVYFDFTKITEVDIYGTPGLERL